MRKSLLAAVAALGVVLSVPSAQALDIRIGSGPAGASSGVAVEVQLAGHRGRDRRGYRLDRLGPRQIVNRLHRQGFRDISNVRPRGHVYVAHARGYRGMPQRLVVDAYSGQVVGRSPIGRGYGHGWGRHGRL
ncbi:hypothetical protein [Stappia indica]|uniref:Peptidase propeptide and YPEB domain-containing protein n=1 Tax=Stappia indica TaxID=538381 RepID=A0A285THB9_9HYPH|nr:hypothetical protein [Stappia indica]MCC4245437.1 hypothetical protein [Stappia indica]SOC21606.1 hypothetical protein SAMN05421512_111126 [Stappia indica]